MEKADNNSLFCSNCNNPVNEDDDFCPECGSLFIDEVYCENHSENLAEGVCIICSTPYCKKCGAMINNHFLCKPHNAYEIYGGMVRIYGTLDDVRAQFIRNKIEEAGFHPLLFSCDQRYGYKYFSSTGNFLGSIVNEIKLMVPCQEVLKAEKVLAKILNNYY